MMTDGYHQSINTLQLAGKGERTQEAYTRAVRMLVELHAKTPDLISEEDLQHDFLHRRNVDHGSPSTPRSGYAGIRFFFEKVLHRDWPLLLRHPRGAASSASPSSSSGVDSSSTCPRPAS